MATTRVRVRRERPTTVAVAMALCVTMLVVYVLTLDLRRPDVIESMASAPRVTRQIEFDRLEGWCVSMARCASRQEARLQASRWVNRGAAGCVAEQDGGWLVLGAMYGSGREAERIAKRLKDAEGIPAEAVRMGAEKLTLRVTAPEAQIEAVAGADALLRRQEKQLGEVALQLDRNEIGADAARTLCAVASSEASEAARSLSAIPGAGENGLCAGLIERLNAMAELQKAVADSGRTNGATLSGMLRCAQIEGFLGQLALQSGMAGQKPGG